MYGAPVSNTLSFTKVLSGLSKTLTVANQVIPLYKQAKPLLNNLNSVKTILSSFTQSNNSTENNSKISKKNAITFNTKSAETSNEINIPNLPTFFR